MILIDRTETDPYFNIAAEEYVLKELDEDVFMLWINKPSVIIGKHQVAAAEADMIYTHQNNIPVIRRISGGGTVYHDEGNLNYSLILRGEKGKLVDYKKYSGTVIRALARHSLNARLEGKSSLVIEGLKFSGNAEHVYKAKVLHHGTLLYNTDFRLLRKCIRPDHRDYVDRSIRSNDTKITNLKEHLPPGNTMKDFRNLIINQIKEDFPEIRNYSFNENDRDSITELAESKYNTKEWNFSYSPKYELNKKFILDEDNYKVSLKTEKGYITDIDFSLEGRSEMKELSAKLIKCLHHPEAIGSILEEIKFIKDLSQTSRSKLLYGIF